jgi:hypothetical protein
LYAELENSASDGDSVRCAGLTARAGVELLRVENFIRERLP